MSKCQDQYEEPIIMQEEGWLIRVYRPILTDDERVRRMKRIEKSATALLKEVHSK